MPAVTCLLQPGVRTYRSFTSTSDSGTDETATILRLKGAKSSSLVKKSYRTALFAEPVLDHDQFSFESSTALYGGRLGILASTIGCIRQLKTTSTALASAVDDDDGVLLKFDTPARGWRVVSGKEQTKVRPSWSTGIISAQSNATE